MNHEFLHKYHPEYCMILNYIEVVDAGGKPEVQVEWKGKTRRFTPEEISAMLLAKVRI